MGKVYNIPPIRPINTITKKEYLENLKNIKKNKNVRPGGPLFRHYENSTETISPSADVSNIADWKNHPELGLYYIERLNPQTGIFPGEVIFRLNDIPVHSTTSQPPLYVRIYLDDTYSTQIGQQITVTSSGGAYPATWQSDPDPVNLPDSEQAAEIVRFDSDQFYIEVEYLDGSINTFTIQLPPPPVDFNQEQLTANITGNSSYGTGTYYTSTDNFDSLTVFFDLATDPSTGLDTFSKPPGAQIASRRSLIIRIPNADLLDADWIPTDPPVPLDMQYLVDSIVWDYINTGNTDYIFVDNNVDGINDLEDPNYFRTQYGYSSINPTTRMNVISNEIRNYQVGQNYFWVTEVDIDGDFNLRPCLIDGIQLQPPIPIQIANLIPTDPEQEIMYFMIPTEFLQTGSNYHLDGVQFQQYISGSQRDSGELAPRGTRANSRSGRGSPLAQLRLECEFPDTTTSRDPFASDGIAPIVIDMRGTSYTLLPVAISPVQGSDGWRYFTYCNRSIDSYGNGDRSSEGTDLPQGMIQENARGRIIPVIVNDSGDEIDLTTINDPAYMVTDLATGDPITWAEFIDKYGQFFYSWAFQDKP
ncbi:hypothetical protein ACFL56_02145 [Candidatus Margulisiibacteriota bacterium]